MSMREELTATVEDGDNLYLTGHQQESLTDLIDALQRRTFSRRFEPTAAEGPRGRRGGPTGAASRPSAE